MLKCSKCGIFKPLEAFYEYLRSQCKDCSRASNREYASKHREEAKIMSKRWRELHPEEYRKTNKSYRVRNKEKIRLYYKNWYSSHGRNRVPDYSNCIKKWQAEHPKERSACSKLNYALANGKISKPDCCQKCGAKCRPHAHHHDYSKPLDVIWLCASCHKLEHLKSEASK